MSGSQRTAHSNAIVRGAMAAAMGSSGSGKGTTGGGTAPFKGASEAGPEAAAMASTGAS